MKKRAEKIDGSTENWENGILGESLEHAETADVSTADVDEALGLQMISIRLPKELIENYKTIAAYHNLGYQPLMRDALKRFAEAEYKRIVAELVNQKTAKSVESSALPTERKAA